MSDPWAPPPDVLADLRQRPAPGEPVAWWRINGDHCDVRVGVDRDGLLCAGDDVARVWVERSGDRTPHGLTAYLSKHGPVEASRLS